MKLDKAISLFTFIFILLNTINCIISISNSEIVKGLIYGSYVLLTVLIYAIYIIGMQIDAYHREVSLLRTDLANLNNELSAAFSAVDNNFCALIEAIDDFAATMEEDNSLN